MQYLQEPKVIFYLIEALFAIASVLIIWNGMLSPLLSKLFTKKSVREKMLNTTHTNISW